MRLHPVLECFRRELEPSIRHYLLRETNKVERFLDPVDQLLGGGVDEWFDNREPGIHTAASCDVPVAILGWR